MLFRAAAAVIAGAGLVLLGLAGLRTVAEPPQLELAAAASLAVLVLAWQLRVDTPIMQRQSTVALGAAVLVCNHPAAPWHQPLAVFAAGMLAALLVFRRWKAVDWYWLLSKVAAAAIFIAVFQILQAAQVWWPAAVAAAWSAYMAAAVATDRVLATAAGTPATFHNGVGGRHAAGTLGVNLLICLAGYYLTALPHASADPALLQVLFLTSACLLALAVTGWLRNRELRRRLSGLVGAARQLPWTNEGAEQILLDAASASVRADQVALRDQGPAAREIGVEMDRWNGSGGYLVASRAGGAQFTEEDEQVLDALAHLGSGMVRHRELISELTHQAETDALTGLGNRRTLWKRLEEINAARDAGEAIAVVYLDLDEFKAVNDRYGHDAGDQVLATTAQRIRAAIRTGDVAARIGGDEFVVVLRHLATEADAQAAASRIAEEIARPMWIGNGRLQVQASAGTAFSARPAKDVEELLQGADSRMYATKRLQQQLREDGLSGAEPSVSLTAAVERGVRHGLLRVALQPVIALDLEAIVGFEALVRYEDEQLGSIPADRLVAEARRLGLLDELTGQVIDGALEAMRAVIAVSAVRSIALNVELGQLEPGSAVLKRLRQLRAEAPELNVIVELTENSLDTLTDQARLELAWLRREGFRIAMDDFGSGYSSMNALTEFDFDIVKVDRSLIREDAGGARNIVVSHLISMFRALQVDVVIEGVETAQTVQWLAGCHGLNAQGFYFGRPMWPEEVIARLEQSGDAALADSPRRSSRPAR